VSSDAHRERLIGLFADRFDGARPTWFVRAPGRINLIGEHTDYNGFPVMPMAINREIRMALSPRDDGGVVLKDAVPDAYPDRRFDVCEEIAPYGEGDWGNYAKAAVQSLVGLAGEAGRPVGGLRGMSCLVDGDIPPAAGLSSSTALVVASGLAFGAVNGLAVGRRWLAERMAEAEHYVGTQGGGMDQAACLLGRAGAALKIDFFPLRARRLPLPRGYRIIAAHSTVRACKTGERLLEYNRRVLECRLGVLLLSRRPGVEPPARLADLAALHPDLDLGAELDALVAGRPRLSADDCAGLLRMEPDEFATRALWLDGRGPFPVPEDGLAVLPRCRHVFREAARVETAAACLASGAAEDFGRLMDESHRSCAEDYGISCPELDELVGLMRGAGALGARLTGAGFGGFAIALARAATVGAIQDALEEHFYAPRGLSAGDSIFVFEPAPGAVVEPLR